MKKLTVAIIGLEHIHASCMYTEFSKHSDMYDIIGCADVPPIEDDFVEDIKTRLERNLKNGLADGIKVYDNYKDLISLHPDVAVVCSNMRSYPLIVEELLSQNINTVIEKPMAMNFEDGRRMYNAYKKSKAFFAVNWPVAWFLPFIKVKELVDGGEIGEVLRVYYRSPATFGPYNHTGKEMTAEETEKLKNSFWYNHNMGGGVSLDYGGYGCTLATWIFGRQPEKVNGIRKNFYLGFSDVEDFLGMTLDFGRGVGIVEGSWATINSAEIPTGPVVHGTKGVIVADRFGTKVKVYKRFSHANTEPDMEFDCPPNEQSYSLGKNLYDHILNKKPLYEMLTPEFNVKALAALDAGIRSSYSGVTEKTKSLEDYE